MKYMMWSRAIPTKNNPHYVDKDGFILGTYIEYENNTFKEMVYQIIKEDGEPINVDRKTVGVYTGVSDKYEIYIFTMDIVECQQGIGIVYYDVDRQVFMCRVVNSKKEEYDTCVLTNEVVVIGNIVYNPHKIETIMSDEHDKEMIAKIKLVDSSILDEKSWDKIMPVVRCLYTLVLCDRNTCALKEYLLAANIDMVYKEVAFIIRTRLYNTPSTSGTNGMGGADISINREIEKIGEMTKGLNFVQMVSSPEVIWARRDKGGKLTTNVPYIKACNSDTGYEIGSGGCGASDLALNILLLYTDDKNAYQLHHKFRDEYIATMDKNGGMIVGSIIKEWIERSQ